MVILVPMPGVVKNTELNIAPGVSGSTMIGLVGEPRTVKPIVAPEFRDIHGLGACSLKRTGPDPYIELKKNKSLLAWLDYLVDIFYENKSKWECECTGFDGNVLRDRG
jgi:hypothetical protein